MISSKNISASQRLKSSVDIFFILRLFLRNSEIQLWKFAWCRVFHNFFADIRMSLEYFDLLSSVCNSNIV